MIQLAIVKAGERFGAVFRLQAQTASEPKFSVDP
jgi:hypothetical protein